mmetsp:Transcript_4539/g.6853  ORF Transcript_4539/g.6853 Transcript_4539/m.6853 type:complete len:337 (+) Transcript_4539:13-1023(+)
MGDSEKLPVINKRQNIRSILYKLPMPLRTISFSRAKFSQTSSLNPNHEVSFKSASTNSSENITKLQSKTESVSAKAWAIADAKTGLVVKGNNETKVKEVASLTKIMTCLLSIKLCEQYEISLQEVITVSKYASQTNGTSARLRENEQLSIYDLLHGLMLPSGNDAAVCLAEYFGNLIAGEEKAVKNPVRYFVREMNKTAKQLQLEKTNFVNPHGMSAPKHRSSAADICKLASEALKSKLFAEICSTKSHTCHMLRPKEFTYRILTWQNTNKLLSMGFNGVKTGVTPSAGPCLCGSLKSGNKHLVLVILASRSMEKRWEDISSLANWALNEFPEAFT